MVFRNVNLAAVVILLNHLHTLVNQAEKIAGIYLVGFINEISYKM